MTGLTRRLREAALRLRDDRRGVGAVEFALIAPVLLILYVGSLELSVAMSVNKKVARASSTIADLITQETDVDRALLKTMPDVAESVLTPFAADNLGIKISAIQIDDTGAAKIAWSWDETDGTPYAKSSAVAVPTKLSVPSTFLVRAEVEMDHDLLLFLPGLEGVEAKTLTMRKTYYLRQRVGDQITCADC